jgi:hypothetical protein
MAQQQLASRARGPLFCKTTIPVLVAMAWALACSVLAWALSYYPAGDDADGASSLAPVLAPP